jgi:ubiquinone/menaquinone biosynthesis C-methylase UbiE
MADSEMSSQMRRDWNARAREDAGYYVAFGQRGQDDEGFFATASEVVSSLEMELRRIPQAQRMGWRALEIGCGPGRLMRPMSRHFAEIHGVDVSDEMVHLAKEKLRDIANAHVYATDGASLGVFETDSFDFVYSYAVFQHIPSMEIVTAYFREIRRILKPGGWARLQINGLPRSGEAFDTWSGARFSALDITAFTRENDFQLLALEGVSTQYMWTTWRKHPRGWHDEQSSRQDADAIRQTLRIRRITNANSSEPVAPCRGRFASISIWVENLPEDAGLHHLRVLIGDAFGTVTYIGPPDNSGVQQLNVLLPELEATGLLPVEIRWIDQPVAPAATLRVIPPGPPVPRVSSVTDGVNLVAGNRIETRSVKVTMEEISRPHEIEAAVDGLPVDNLEFFCVDPRPQRFEINFRLPEAIQQGTHSLELRIGRRKLAPIPLDVAG